MNAITKIPENIEIPITVDSRRVSSAIIDEREFITTSYVDLHKVVSWAQMSDYRVFVSDGAWEDVSLFRDEKAKLNAPTIKDDGSFDKFVIVHEHDHLGMTWANCLLRMGEALARRESKLIVGKNKHLASVFPGGYRVVNHLVKKASDAKVRKDTYIYGHWSGERYRSMTDFAIHYAHLVVDYQGSGGKKTQDCECILCVKYKSAVFPEPE